VITNPQAPPAPIFAVQGSGSAVSILTGQTGLPPEPPLYSGAPGVEDGTVSLHSFVLQGRNLKGKSPFPVFQQKPEKVAQDINAWLRLEAPKQREMAPRGFYSLTTAVGKFKRDRKTAPENVEVKNVSINGYLLELRQIRWFAVQVEVRFRSNNHYWYDAEAGFIGKLGGPIKWRDVPPLLPLPGKMDPICSLGETKIYINGRELPPAEVKAWKAIDMQLLDHTNYYVNPTGWVRRDCDTQRKLAHV